MCRICDREGLVGRRALLGLGLAGLAAATLGTGSARAAGGPTTSLTADQALEKLKAGNARYVAGPELCVQQLAASRAALVSGQTPWATILSCADSRVPPELLFGGVGPGELFVARNAGNMAGTATMGTIEYGAAALGVPLIVVLGHEKCGAVSAACDVLTKDTKYPGSMGRMLKPIVPACKAVAKQPGDMVDNAVRENARRVARRVATKSPIVADLVKAGKVKVVAARYDLDEGRVEFLS
ncbi:carbonic anhydrase [Allostella sp. ATCC 35155]|nr:carbonic anhydrase [Stella sp. ATCC 35155]